MGDRDARQATVDELAGSVRGLVTALETGELVIDRELEDLERLESILFRCAKTVQATRVAASWPAPLAR